MLWVQQGRGPRARGQADRGEGRELFLFPAVGPAELRLEGPQIKGRKEPPAARVGGGCRWWERRVLLCPGRSPRLTQCILGRGGW